MENQDEIDRIAKKAVLEGLDESINRYLQRIEELSREYRQLANELYPQEQQDVSEQGE